MRGLLKWLVKPGPRCDENTPVNACLRKRALCTRLLWLAFLSRWPEGHPEANCWIAGSNEVGTGKPLAAQKEVLELYRLP